MGRYRCIFFDFDGTLINSEISITDSVRYTLEKRGIFETDREKLRRFIGPPLVESYMNYYGFRKEEACEAVEDYRYIYRKKNILRVNAYEGICQTLEKLKSKGLILCIASSKPLPMIEEISNHLDIAQYFDEIFGATLDGRIIRKEDVIYEAIKYIKEKHPDIDMSEILMVGDRRYDAEGSKAFNIDCVGVKYGFADEGELEEAGCVYIIDKPEELLAIIGISENS